MPPTGAIGSDNDSDQQSIQSVPRAVRKDCRIRRHLPPTLIADDTPHVPPLGQYLSGRTHAEF